MEGSWRQWSFRRGPESTGAWQPVFLDEGRTFSSDLNPVVHNTRPWLANNFSGSVLCLEKSTNAYATPFRVTGQFAVDHLISSSNCMPGWMRQFSWAWVGTWYIWRTPKFDVGRSFEIICCSNVSMTVVAALFMRSHWNHDWRFF